VASEEILSNQYVTDLIYRACCRTSTVLHEKIFKTQTFVGKIMVIVIFDYQRLGKIYMYLGLWRRYSKGGDCIHMLNPRDTLLI
jgi:hypothetical protein